MLGSLKTLLSSKEQVETPKSAVPLTQLEPATVIQFSADALIPDLRGKKAMVQSVRTYRFAESTTVSYLLSMEAVESLILTIAEDEEGYYLGISRELNPEQQHLWFDRDALSFFTEPSSAKTLKSRVTDLQFPGWVAAKYVKSIEFMKGTLTQGRLSTSDAARKTQAIEYNLLVNDTGDKAVEIELYPELKTHRVYVTVYRPADEIVQISQPIPHIPAPEMKPKSIIETPKPIAVTPKAEPAVVQPKPAMIEAKPAEVPAVAATPSRPDFRRLNVGEEVPVIKRTAAPVKMIDDELEQTAPVPQFLVGQTKEVTRSKYLTLDEVLPPEIERVRCDISTAKLLIDTSIKRGVRVRDLLRQMTGLNTPAHDEVLFEMPLSDADYRQLAQRYQMKPDMHAEIRARMIDELQKKLKQISS